MRNELKDKVGDLLINLGIAPSIKGFYYILDAVEIFTKNPATKSKDILEIIAIRHNATSARVERALRFAFLKMDEEKAIEYFGSNNYASMGYISIIAWKEGMNNG